MTIVAVFCCQTIRQKSFVVSGKGPYLVNETINVKLYNYIRTYTLFHVGGKFSEYQQTGFRFGPQQKGIFFFTNLRKFDQLMLEFMIIYA